MPSAYNTSPPNYADPSAADDISSLICTALEIQEDLFNATERLRRVNVAGVAIELLPRLIDTDEKYLKLLNESRTSAIELYSAIENFMDVAIPFSQDARNSVEERVAVAKDFADKIAASAQQDLQPYDKQLETLKENLNKLVDDLTAIKAALKDRSESIQNDRSLSPLSNATLKSKDKHDNKSPRFHKRRHNLKFLLSRVELLGDEARRKLLGTTTTNTKLSSSANEVHDNTAPSNATPALTVTTPPTAITRGTSRGNPFPLKGNNNTPPLKTTKSPSPKVDRRTLTKTITSPSATVGRRSQRDAPDLKWHDNTPPLKATISQSITSKDISTQVEALVSTSVKTATDTPTPKIKTATKTISLPASGAVNDTILRDISALVDLFSGIIGKLGHFDAVWEKLVADSSELSGYLSRSTDNPDSNIIGHRVQAEVGVYERIQQALDDYCLQTTSSGPTTNSSVRTQFPSKITKFSPRKDVM